MKIPPVFLAMLAALVPLAAQEAAKGDDPAVVVAPERVALIPGPIADGTPSPPASKVEPPDFAVKSTTVRRMEVVESPEIAGLPPVKGTITATVHLVEDPGLTDPPPPLPALPPDDPAVLARMAEMRTKHPKTELVFLSATVFDHHRTLLRWYPNGEVAREMSAWSNLDFNHFGGFGIYRVAQADGTYREYGLLMGIGNTDTRQTKRRLEEHGLVYQEPGIPELPDFEARGPAFVLAEATRPTGRPWKSPRACIRFIRWKAVEWRRLFMLEQKPMRKGKPTCWPTPPFPIT